MLRLLALFALLAAGSAHAEYGWPTQRITRLTREILPKVVQTFNHDFTAACLPSGWTYARSGTAWDWTASGVHTSYAANAPMCPGYWARGATNYGFGIWGARTNYFLNSLAPATQTVTHVGAGTYIASVVGSGSIAISGTGISCTATAASPCAYQTSSALQTATFTVSGSPACVQTEFVFAATVNATPTPCIPTAGSSVGRSADTLWRDLAALGLGNARGAIRVKFFVPTLTSNLNRSLAFVSATNANDGFTFYLRGPDGKLQGACQSAGIIGYSAVTANAILPGQVNTAILQWDRAKGLMVALNGGAFVRVASNSSCGGVNLQRLTLGSNAAGANQLNGYVLETTIYLGRYVESYAQALSAPPLPAFSGALTQLFFKGQSLGAGRTRGVNPPITTSCPYPTRVFMPNDIWGVAGTRLNSRDYAYQNPGTSGLVCAFEAEGVNPPLVPSDWTETGIVAAAAEMIFEGSSDNYVVRSIAAGAQPLAAIMKGSGSYDNGTALASTLKGFSAAAGGSYQVSWLFDIHGESDRNNDTTRATYLALNNTRTTSERTDYKAITGQSANPKSMAMQLSGSGVANGTGSEISLAQYDIAIGAVANGDWRLCAPRYMLRYTPEDGLHVTAASYVWMGELLGHCARVEEASGQPWRPVHPTALAFDTSNKALIRTTWNVPVPPLVVNSSDLPQGPAYMRGLQYRDDCVDASLAAGAQPYAYITNVALTGATTIDVTLNAARNPACGTPRLQNAYDGPGVVSQTSLPTIAAAGSGGTDGACVVTVSLNPSDPGVAQAQYNVTITGGALASVNSVAYPGLYPPWRLATSNNVPVTGCGLSGAQLSSVNVRRGLSGLAMSGAWSDIADSDATVSRSGNVLRGRAAIFDLEVAL